MITQWKSLLLARRHEHYIFHILQPRSMTTKKKNDARFFSFFILTHPNLMKIFLRRRVLKNFLNETLEKFVHLAYLLWLIPIFSCFHFLFSSSRSLCLSPSRRHTPHFNSNELHTWWQRRSYDERTDFDILFWIRKITALCTNTFEWLNHTKLFFYFIFYII